MKNLVKIFPLAERQRDPNKAEIIPIPVDRTLSPFIITGAKKKALLLGEAKRPFVYASISHGKISSFYREAIMLAYESSEKYKWGFSFHCTPEGVDAAIEHVSNYDFEGGLSLFSSEDSFLSGDSKYQGFDNTVSPWLPSNCVVVTLQDVSYLGGALVGSDYYVAVLHNIKRTLGVAWGPNQP